MKRSLLTTPLASIAAMFFVASEVFAGDTAGDTHAEQTRELLHWDFGAALWSIFVFVILLIILRISAWKPILAALNQRESSIKASIADARREREESQKLLAEYTARLEKAREEATSIVEEGRRDGEETRKRLNAEAQKEADARLERAKKDIALARDDAVKQLHDQTIVLAAAIAGKMLRRELKLSDHKDLLDESLGELGRMNN